MGEVKPHIRLIVGILEVIDPARRVGIDVDDIAVLEVMQRRQRAVDGHIDYPSFVIDIGSVFGYHHHGVLIYRDVGIPHAVGRIETVFAQCRLHLVKV